MVRRHLAREDIPNAIRLLEEVAKLDIPQTAPLLRSHIEADKDLFSKQLEALKRNQDSVRKVIAAIKTDNLVTQMREWDFPVSEQQQVEEQFVGAYFGKRSRLMKEFRADIPVKRIPEEEERRRQEIEQHNNYHKEFYGGVESPAHYGAFEQKYRDMFHSSSEPHKRLTDLVAERIKTALENEGCNSKDSGLLANLIQDKDFYYHVIRGR